MSDNGSYRQKAAQYKALYERERECRWQAEDKLRRLGDLLREILGDA